ncbi:MAG: GIY-YIG nuclease family protein [Candidatus Moranbacteria bacterium]|nr:GIY-YIG nuclease family protein [Candidatus Moranbacteria bacterium]
MLYVYVLKSNKDSKNYVGFTKNLKLRLTLLNLIFI